MLRPLAPEAYPMIVHPLHSIKWLLLCSPLHASSASHQVQPLASSLGIDWFRGRGEIRSRESELNNKKSVESPSLILGRWTERQASLHFPWSLVCHRDERSCEIERVSPRDELIRGRLFSVWEERERGDSIRSESRHVKTNGTKTQRTSALNELLSF